MKKNLLLLVFAITGLLSTTTVIAQVTANQPSDIVMCGENDFAIFDLTHTEPAIIGGQDPTNLVISFFVTQADATNATNVIANPTAFPNSSNPQAIYARLEDFTNGDFDTTSFVIWVEESPVAFTPSPLLYCDDNNDGFGEFTLTDADLEIIGGIPTGVAHVSYHYLQSDAEIGINSLPNTYFNDVPFNQIVYARLIDQITGCYDTTELELIVFDSPQIIQPTDLELYDDNGDGIEVFDLTLVEPELLNGLDPNLYSVYYYEDINFTMPINNPTSYSNIAVPQTIFIQVEEIANQCQSQTNFNLVLVDVIIEEEPEDLYINEGDNNGLAIFDLTINEAQMLGGQDPLIALFTYHTSLLDATNGDNTIATPTAYQNIINPQTIFVRLTNSNTGSYVLTNFNIETDGNLGIENNFIKKLKLYPNPTDEFVSIQSDYFLEQVEVIIYNVQGQIMASENRSPINAVINLDVSNFLTGIYFVKVMSGENTVVKRIIKN